MNLRHLSQLAERYRLQKRPSHVNQSVTCCITDRGKLVYTYMHLYIQGHRSVTKGVSIVLGFVYVSQKSYTYIFRDPVWKDDRSAG